MSDFYQTLEIRPNASLEEIKKAYRRLARMYHPDACGTHLLGSRFHEIQEAYDVLSDLERRKRYNNEYGFANWTQEKVKAYRRNQAHADSFSRKNKSENTKKTGASSKSSKTPPDSKAGTKKKVQKRTRKDTVTNAKKILDRLQKGIRGTFDKSDSSSSTLHPKTSSSETKTFDLDINALESLHGTSREVSFKQESGPRKIRVNIPPGVANGAVLKVDCPETASHKAETVRIFVSVSPHPLVERDGLHIVVKMPITIGEALNGTELRVPTLDGSVVVKVPPCWDIHKRLRVKNRGVQLPSSGKRGDLLVQIEIIPPNKNDKNTKESGKFIDKFYENDVRASIPKSLSKKS